MKASADKSVTTSIWTALTLKDTKTQMYAFTYSGFLGLPLLIMIGPAKSVPDILKTVPGVTLDLNSCSMTC